MPKDRAPLDDWEIALAKAMLRRGGFNDQEILAYFTRPSRSVNHRVISEIRTAKKHRGIPEATPDELAEFLATWPDASLLRGDELVTKAREAMLAAVHTFNGAGLTFRAELFIVTSIIAWTYLFHAWFKREGKDYRHRIKGEVQKTREGADKYWELSQCIKQTPCPISDGAAQNLNFLLELRHEIEHRSTSRIDDTIAGKLQACCINFNEAIKRLFGPEQGLERRLPIALQFVTFGSEQRSLLKKASSLPRHVEAMMDAFDKTLTVAQRDDLAFTYRVNFAPKIAGRASASDEVIGRP